MHCYLVTYHFTKEIENYDSFFNEITSLSENKYKQLFDGCLLVMAGNTVTAVRKLLLPHLQPLDRLFITKVQYNEIAGQLPDSSKKWIKENIVKY